MLLRIVARFADIWNNMGVHHREVSAKLAALKAHCETIGRDPTEIEISQQTLGAIGSSSEEARRNTEAVHNELGFLTNAPELCLTGTPTEVIARVKRNVGLGIKTFIVSFARHAGVKELALFAKEVIPVFR